MIAIISNLGFIFQSHFDLKENHIINLNIKSGFV